MFALNGNRAKLLITSFFSWDCVASKWFQLTIPHFQTLAIKEKKPQFKSVLSTQVGPTQSFFQVATRPKRILWFDRTSQFFPFNFVLLTITFLAIIQQKDFIKIKLVQKVDRKYILQVIKE